MEGVPRCHLKTGMINLIIKYPLGRRVPLFLGLVLVEVTLGSLFVIQKLNDKRRNLKNGINIFTKHQKHKVNANIQIT